MSTPTITGVRTDGGTSGPGPGAVSAVAAAIALVVGYVVSRFFATGCGAPGQNFSCLIEGLVVGASAPVLVPLAGWLLLRAAGARRALPTALLGTALAATLVYPVVTVVEFVHATGGSPLDDASPGESLALSVAVALSFGTGAACATLLLSGRVGWMAWAVIGGCIALAVGLASLTDTVQRDQDLRADLAGADVPLLAPPEGWVVHDVHVSDAGYVKVITHPEGEDVYLERTVNVVVSLAQPVDSCAYDVCRTTPDGLLLATSETSTNALTEVDGAFVEVTSYDRGPVVEAAVLDVARGLRAVDVDAFADLAG